MKRLIILCSLLFIIFIGCDFKSSFEIQYESNSLQESVQESEQRVFYTEILTKDEELIKEFNEKIKLTRSIKRFSKDTPVQTPEQKLDLIALFVQKTLDMWPSFKVKYALYKDRENLSKYYEQRYGKGCDYIAFYIPSDSTIHLSVQDVSVRVLSHELSHAIVHSYFDKEIPDDVDELIAQYVVSKI